MTGYCSFWRSFSNGLCGKSPSFCCGHSFLGVLPVKSENAVVIEHVLKHWKLPVFFWNSSLSVPGTAGSRERFNGQRGRDRGSLQSDKGKMPDAHSCGSGC